MVETVVRVVLNEITPMSYNICRSLMCMQIQEQQFVPINKLYAMYHISVEKTPSTFVAKKRIYSIIHEVCRWDASDVGSQMTRKISGIAKKIGI